MGACSSKNKAKISNEYILMVQHMLRDLETTSFNLLLEVEILNNMMYGYDIYFDYERNHVEFVVTIKKMEDILNSFERNNETILMTLEKKPHAFWIYFIEKCNNKCKKMREFDLQKKKIEEAFKRLEMNRDDIPLQYQIIKKTDRAKLILESDIDHFNKTMSLPSIHIKNIKPMLSNVLKNSRPLTVNPL